MSCFSVRENILDRIEMRTKAEACALGPLHVGRIPGSLLELIFDHASHTRVNSECWEHPAA